MLNLYLKYLWCMGHLPHEPPHFPVDAIMLRKIPSHASTYWTKLQTIDQYQAIIEAARPIAAKTHLSVAQWELEVFRST